MMIARREVYSRTVLLLIFLLPLFLVPLSHADYCGDINKDGTIDILDIVQLINYKYKDAPAPVPKAICDVDKSGEVNILDIICIINFKYKDGAPLECYFYDCATIRGDCLSRRADSLRSEAQGNMNLVVDGQNLHIYHKDAYYNCCLEYYTGYSILGNEINIFEFDSGQPCDCNCSFNLESIIENIPIGQYTVTLFGMDGDTIGTESIEIVLPELTDYSASDCLEKARADIDYTYDNGTLIMTHYDAYFFCAADFVIEFEKNQNTLKFYENNISSGMTTCKCFFELSATISNLPPGTYVTEIYQKASPFHQYELYDSREILLE